MLVVDSAVYPIASIASYRQIVSRRDPGWWWVGAVLSGLPATGLALLAINSEGGSMEWESWSITMAIIMSIFALCVWQIVACRRVTHQLVLQTAGGEVKAFRAATRAQLADVASALGKAVAARG